MFRGTTPIQNRDEVFLRDSEFCILKGLLHIVRSYHCVHTYETSDGTHLARQYHRIGKNWQV